MQCDKLVESWLSSPLPKNLTNQHARLHHADRGCAPSRFWCGGTAFVCGWRQQCYSCHRKATNLSFCDLAALWNATVRLWLPALPDLCTLYSYCSVPSSTELLEFPTQMTFEVHNAWTRSVRRDWPYLNQLHPCGAEHREVTGQTRVNVCGCAHGCVYICAQHVILPACLRQLVCKSQSGGRDTVALQPKCWAARRGAKAYSASSLFATNAHWRQTGTLSRALQSHSVSEYFLCLFWCDW